MAKPKSTIRVGQRDGKVVVTKKPKGVVNGILKKLGK